MSDLFEDFSLGPQPKSIVATAAHDALESFDKGYKAGWEDARKAHEDSQTTASSVLVNSLKNLEYTVEEARALVVSSLSPILIEIADTLLPEIRNKSLQAHLTKELRGILADCLPSDVKIECSSADIEAIKSLLDAAQLHEVSVYSKDTLGDGQVRINCTSESRQIDIGEALSSVRQAIANFQIQTSHIKPE